mgnify:CR=1 FL=1
MSWQPNDLVTDQDLVDYEAAILTQFGQTDWQGRRRKAIEDWLFPHLRTRGFDPLKLRTRYEPDAVQSYTASAYTDRVAAAKDAIKRLVLSLDEVKENLAAFDMGKELGAKAAALRRPLDQAGNVGHDEFVPVDADDAESLSWI